MFTIWNETTVDPEKNSKMNRRDMHRVYFDGTYATAAEVMRACDIGKVWIVMSRDLDRAELAFLTNVCQRDICGTRGHFERARYVKHESFGSARFCDASWSTAEDLISRIAHDDAIDDEEKLYILSHMLRPCARATCGTCVTCVEASRVAEKYGIYDLDEALRDRNLESPPRRMSVTN
tara:strand:- start:3525 stop:4058 length:534 start_codon:yes stop_codon:yes gene_type:complete